MKECCGWKDQALDAGLLIIRVLTGLAMAYHGYHKVFGGQVNMLIDGLTQMGLPAPVILGWLAALAEFAGGLCLALGLGTRVAAFFIFFTMCVAFFKAHAHDPWQVKELAYLYGAVTLGLIFTGGGRFSIDSFLCCRKSTCCNKEVE